MKKIAILSWAVLLAVSCNAQEQDKKNKEESLDKAKEEQLVEVPKGTWKVDKEFDENGNLIRYDSIYSWSSLDNADDIPFKDRDSLLQSFQSKFFSHFQGMEQQGLGNFFRSDSLLMDRFFNDDFFKSDFGRDFMDIDHMRQRMEEMERRFLERYQPEINSQNEEDSGI